MIRVLLVDDQRLVRTGFRMLLQTQPDLTVVAEAGDGGEAIEAVSAHRVDVVLMDVRMPTVDGVTACRRIRALPDPPRVLVLTTFDLDEYAFAAIRAGASGFLLKDAPPEDLLSAIRVVHSGDSVVAPSTTRRLLERFTPYLPEAGPGPADALTDREREVLLLVARGCSNAEIAAELFVAETTVKSHISRILTKLGLRDRVQIVVYAYQHGLAR
ncbi:DNA-binding NarL/FixJ family response regulator [Catenuloplanes nepalensis]|uniref:DNA-binding NarL/FixJ family response regulator n=1 Tax=Catenuloplanes nepalensis TaxID=587533 RepID=A0ABT9N197_9ACTN|nr:response regulator transcription factor [Catenuloplanes nepalensis]MDP9797370.1 DNA-binding NarL/FixJ family response regulator [Catenuloplanes nepalensis]